MNRTDGVWWGDCEVGIDRFGVWRIGPLVLVAERAPSEWILHYWVDEMAPEERLEKCVVSAPPPIPEDALAHRFVFGATTDVLALSPVLADRPVISKPQAPLHVMPGEKVRLYVHTPVWVRVASGKEARKLLELPVVRMSDTWFGPNQREGEICYATPAPCTTRLEGGSQWPHGGVLTPVFVKSRAAEPLKLERIQLPSPWLSIYQNENGGLWTQPITLELGRTADSAEVSIGKNLPEEAGDARMLAPARLDGQGSFLTRSLRALISELE